MNKRTDLPDKQNRNPIHEILKSFLPTFETVGKNSHIIDQAFDAALRAITDMFPSRFAPKKPINSSNNIMNKEESIFHLRNRFENNPKSVIRDILPNSTPMTKPPLGDIRTHYTKQVPPPINHSLFAQFPTYTEEKSDLPITIEEIEKAFKSTDANSAPGQDKMTFTDWKAIDPNHIFLLRLFNFILKSRSIPSSWKTYKTLLIIKPMKSETAHLISSWRPIAILNTSYRLFATIIRLLEWVFRTQLQSMLVSEGMMPMSPIQLQVNLNCLNHQYDAPELLAHKLFMALASWPPTAGTDLDEQNSRLPMIRESSPH